MLFLFQYPSLIRIQKIHLPSLFISGMSDALIPPAMMNELYEVWPNTRFLYSHTPAAPIYIRVLHYQLYSGREINLYIVEGGVRKRKIALVP